MGKRFLFGAAGLLLLLLPAIAGAWLIGDFQIPAKKAKPQPVVRTRDAAGARASGAVAAASAKTPGSTFTEPVTGMEFVWVPAGCFQMGSPSSESGRDDDEGPVHRVCVDGFWIGKYEVTNAEYRKFKSGYDSGSFKGNSLNGAKQPVVNVSWNDAVAFAKWLSRKAGRKFRLPTEAEWEYACRAGTTTARFWGDGEVSACSFANVNDRTSKKKNNFSWPSFDCDDGYAVTAPVGSFRANAFGLYDMLGNVWEWCSDWYGENYYDNSPTQNPQGSGSGSNRVFRGGSWFISPRRVRSASRGRCGPGFRYNRLGFRLVASGRR